LEIEERERKSEKENGEKGMENKRIKQNPAKWASYLISAHLWMYTARPSF
jgi:hypothetical protein